MLESENILEYFARVFNIYNQNKRICGEDKRETYDREAHVLTAKEVSLYGGRDRGVTKYRCSFNLRFHGKITSP
jgi:hypothetical protein